MKIQRFWKIYISVTVIAAAVLLCGMGVFYDFIRAYEQSQPGYTADSYAAGVTRRNLRAMVEEAVKEMPAFLEPEEEAVRILAESLPAGTYTCRRILSLGDTQNPVYGLYSGDLLLGHVTLGEGKSGRYGFRSWVVKSAVLLPENIPAQRQTYTMFAPSGSTVTVNGTVLGDEWMTEAEVPYPSVSPFENWGTETGIRYDVDLLMKPEAVCTLDGAECTVFAEGEGFYFFQPQQEIRTCRIVVPEGSAVTVNGVPLTEQYAEGERIPYEYSPVEQDREPLPVAVSYTVAGLLELPTVEAVLDGAVVPVEWDEESASFTGTYPAELQYTCVIAAPAGSTVTIRGLDASPWLTEKTESPYALLFEEIGAPPALVQYRIPGLYLPPEDVAVIWNGQSLPVTSGMEGNLSSWDAKYPETENEAAAALARTFAETYFHYTSRGYDGLYTNLAQVLAFVNPSSALYQRIQNSVNGFYYVTPATSMEYKKLEVERMTEIQPGCVICTMAFDIDQYVYHVNRRYSGTMTLYLEQSGDTYRIGGMSIEND